MIKNKASWVALGVLAIATALMVFVVQPNLRDNAEEETARSSAGSGQTVEPAQEAKIDKAPAAMQGTDSEQTTARSAGSAASDPAASGAPVPAADWTVPGFDLLRVEPDGSTVVAGRAEPGTKLEILSGDTVVGTAEVNAAGDFAAVFDKPLAAGDHQLTLRSVGAGGASKMSDEVATISVPRDPGGQLLAMVSKPGEASRLITTPKAEEMPAQAAAKPTAPTDAPATPNGVPGLQVTAVEIEGTTMFVAGNAKPGALVRIYADDKLLGEVKADDSGHFVIDGAIELSVGSHIIRADMMNDDASKVAMRAAVPFDRPAGAQVAAIASAPANTATNGLDGLKAEAAKALALLKGLYAGGKQPTAEQLAAARSATEFALQSLAEFKPADSSEPGLAAAANGASKAAREALAILKSSPQDSAGVVAALDKVDGVIGPALPQQAAGTASAKPKLSAGADTMSAAEPPKLEAPQGAAADPATKDIAAAAPVKGEQQPTTIQQAPLKESKNTVIIRRGDTLWQISRRVYGAGLRYTTIYLANREQIGNPDLIQPGQVFGVPDTALSDEDSREIHRKHMKH